MQMRAAIFRRPHEPLIIEEVEIADPIGKEVLVRTAASGVCHSDKHSLDDLVGARWSGFDRVVLGHEGSGVVEAIGPEVTYVEPGDHVVACLSGFCGSCEQCLRGAAEPLHREGGRGDARRRGAAEAVDRWSAGAAGLRDRQSLPRRCCCTRTRW